MSASTEDVATFDEYATEYDAALAQGLAVSGESKEFFARGRIVWFARRLPEIAPNFARENAGATVFDFGCGTGSATPFLLELLPIENVLGVDVSMQSLVVARHDYAQLKARFMALSEYSPRGENALAFCNGVFHHIPPDERADAARTLFDALRPGGIFAFWENNPWNPGTRLVMKRCAFDRDAITLSPPQARTLLQNAGFEIVDTNFLFIFPRILSGLRPLEARAARWPLGAQYQVICRKTK